MDISEFKEGLEFTAEWRRKRPANITMPAAPGRLTH